MSSFNEHISEQEALTSRFEKLTKIGILAHELGADIDLCEDEEEALGYCAERQEKMNTLQLRIFDEARMDSYEDASENTDEASIATARSVIFDYFSPKSAEDDTSHLSNGEFAAPFVKAYNLLMGTGNMADEAIAEKLHEQAPALFDYDENGNFTGHLQNEGGWTP